MQIDTQSLAAACDVKMRPTPALRMIISGFCIYILVLSRCAKYRQLQIMGDLAQAVFQRAFRSGIAQAFDLSPQSEIIYDSELFYSNFQQNVAIWNPNIPTDANSAFPGANNVIYDFPLKNEKTRNLTHLCVTSPFDSFGRAISCLTAPFVSLGLADAPTSDLDLAAGYGVHRDVAGTASNMSRTFASYLSNGNMAEPKCTMDILVRNETMLDLQNIAECMGYICRNANSLLKISPDIIGIGVWTAYFIQIGICFIAPMLAILFGQLIKKSTPHSRPGSRSTDSGGTSSKQMELKQKPTGGKLKTLEAAFTTGLVDFQKAQCYYMLAIQIASMSIHHRTGAEGTIAQREATSIVVRVVATLGIVAPTITMLCLQILEQRSWYILLLTLAASSLSINVLSDEDITTIHDRFFVNPEVKNTQYINTDPFSLCSVKLGGDDTPWRGLSTPWAMYLCAVILAFIIVDHIFNLGLPRVKDRSYLRPYCKVQCSFQRFVAHLNKRRETALINPVRRTIYTLTKLFIRIGVFITCFYILGQIISSLYSFYSAAKVSHDWSFGQIVSVAIWIPVVVDWLLLSIRGMDSGSEYRIPHPFRVQEVDSSISQSTAMSNFDDTTSEDITGTELEHQDFPSLSRRRTATAEF